MNTLLSTLFCPAIEINNVVSFMLSISANSTTVMLWKPSHISRSIHKQSVLHIVTDNVFM